MDDYDGSRGYGSSGDRDPLPIAEHNRMIDEVLLSLAWLAEKMDIIGSVDRNALSLRIEKQFEFINGLKK